MDRESRLKKYNAKVDIKSWVRKYIKKMKIKISKKCRESGGRKRKRNDTDKSKKERERMEKEIEKLRTLERKSEIRKYIVKVRENNDRKWSHKVWWDLERESGDRSKKRK